MKPPMPILGPAEIDAGGSDLLLDAYTRHCESLKRFLTRRLRCPETAEDLVQETWLRIAHGTERTLIPVNPRAYLFRIASNLAIDHLRREKRRSEIIGEIVETAPERTDEFTPERHHLARAELAFMQQAITTLPDRCRHVFYLSRYEEVPRREIARRLGISVTTVEKDLRRTLRQLANARRAFRDATAPEDGSTV